MADLLAGFHSITELQVRWGDMDAYRHVNNTVYFRFFESARIGYFQGIGFGGQPQGVSPVLHTATCRFRVPLTYPDTVWVASRVTELGKDRFKMYQRVVSQQHQVVAAEGSNIIVAFDYDLNQVGQFSDKVYQMIVERDQPALRDRISL